MNVVKQIGNIYEENGYNSQAGRVYDEQGLAPTLDTCSGGNKMPKIIEKQVKKAFDLPKEIINDNERQRRVYDTSGISPSILSRQDSPKIYQLGNINPNETGQSGTVYDAKGISPTLDTCQGGNRMPKIVEPMIVASRGRNPQNPSDRTPGNHVEQRLEPNSDGLCNTLTSVQKDNLVLEPKLVGGLGEKDWGSQWRQGNRVYDSNAVAMALHAQPAGNTGGNSYLYLVDETVKIKQATQQGYVECKLGGVADLSYPTSKTRRGRVQDNGDTCPTLTATETGVCRIETPYRIRKLTPLECWRLMGFTDEDFHEAEKVNSNTQLYKQAGNSICVPVLEGIFKQML